MQTLRMTSRERNPPPQNGLREYGTHETPLYLAERRMCAVNQPPLKSQQAQPERHAGGWETRQRAISSVRSHMGVSRIGGAAALCCGVVVVCAGNRREPHSTGQQSLRTLIRRYKTTKIHSGGVYCQCS
jgi:hypothetical protein